MGGNREREDAPSGEARTTSSTLARLQVRMAAKKQAFYEEK
jgi:hypothetical protein